MKTALFCLLVAGTFDLISAITPKPRFFQGCVLLKSKIYCYGGGQYVAGATNYNTVYSDHFVLDLSKDFAINDAQDAWTSVPSPSDFVLEPNYKYGFAAINDTSYIVTSGSGYNDNKTPLKNKTTVYRADLDKWVSIPTAANQSIGATLNFDNNGKGYLFGGIQTYTNIIPIRNLMTLTMNTNQWAQIPLGSSNIFRADHASAMDNDGVIYYTGGRLGTPSGGIYSWNTNVPMTSITTYNTTSQTWGSISVSGDNPTLRNSHTFTYLPKDNLFVLFGGKQGLTEIPGNFEDICYTFDPKARSWTRRNVAQIGSGSRFGHSAVLYNDLYLFIIFGGDQGSMTMSDFKVLNVKNWSWVSQFSALGLPDNGQGSGNGTGNGNGTSPGDGQTPPPSPISGGAIAGIVIGVLAAIGIAIGAFFFLRRRRNNNNNNNSNHNNNQGMVAEGKHRGDFEMDQEFEVPPAPQQYFSQTTQDFINGGNKTNQGQSPLDQQQPAQDNRVYHPDELSTSTAPTYTSGTPIMVSPSSPVSTTVVGSEPGSRQRQYKPDLTMDTAQHTFDQEPVKPHGLH